MGNWLVSQQQQKNPFWGVESRWPKAPGCCLCGFALVPIFFGTSVSKQNSLVITLWEFPVSRSRGCPVIKCCPLGKQKCIWRCSSTHRCSLIPWMKLPVFFHSRALQELCALEGTGAAPSPDHHPPSPAARSCGLCQSSLLMLSSLKTAISV